MNQDTVNTIIGIAQVVLPAIAAFFVGHFHVLPGTKPTDPIKPADSKQLPIGQGGLLQMLANVIPFLPTPKPGEPIAPIGKGGILQLLGLVAQGVSSHPTATPEQKSAAVSQVASALAPFSKE